MARTGVLLSLSREHHASLVIARAARKAADSKDTGIFSEALALIEAHWCEVLAVHFAQEEKLICRASEILDPKSVEHILAEHAELRMLARGPCILEPVVRLQQFGNLLSVHVRYEERVLFPQLQSHSSIHLHDYT